MANYRLDREELLQYAKLASNIRHNLSLQANLIDQDGNELELDDESRAQLEQSIDRRNRPRFAKPTKDQ